MSTVPQTSPVESFDGSLPRLLTLVLCTKKMGSQEANNYFRRMGWLPATAVIVVLTLSTIYSGTLLLRLYQAVPNAVLFGDIGEAAAGSKVTGERA